MEFNEFLFSLRALHCHCMPVACYFRMSLRLFVACHVFTVTGVTVANTFTSVNTSTQQLWGISMVLTDAQSGLKTHADKFNLLWFWRIVDTPKDRSVFNHYQQSQSQIRLWPAHTNVHLALLSFNFLLSVSQPLTVPSRIQRQSSVGATLATCAHIYGMHKITETQEKPTTALTRKHKRVWKQLESRPRGLLCLWLQCHLLLQQRTEGHWSAPPALVALAPLVATAPPCGATKELKKRYMRKI